MYQTRHTPYYDDEQIEMSNYGQYVQHYGSSDQGPGTIQYYGNAYNAGVPPHLQGYYANARATPTTIQTVQPVRAEAAPKESAPKEGKKEKAAEAVVAIPVVETKDYIDEYAAGSRPLNPNYPGGGPLTDPVVTEGGRPFNPNYYRGGGYYALPLLLLLLLIAGIVGVVLWATIGRHHHHHHYND
jgi:hypothetical protein